MPTVPPFNSLNEANKQAADQLYHNNRECVMGRDIPTNERREGTGSNLRLWDRGAELNGQGRELKAGPICAQIPCFLCNSGVVRAYVCKGISAAWNRLGVAVARVQSRESDRNA